MQNQRIRIRLKAFDHRLIDQSTPRNRRYGTTHWRASSRSNPSANEQRAFHYPDFATR